MSRTKNKIELLVEAKVKEAIRELDKTEKELDQLSKQGDKTSAVFGKMKTALGGFIGIMAAKQVAAYSMELAKLGDAAKQVEKPFTTLVNRAGKDAVTALNILRKAVRGTATDLELMQRTGAAMDAFTASGMNAAEAFEATQKTMDFLYRYSTKFGKDFNELMRTVFTGLQRGSALFLDDVGIMIDQTAEQFKGLDAVEKKAAIVRESLEQMAKKNALLGDVTERSNVKIKQSAVEFENLKAALGSMLDEPVGEFFSFITGTLKDITTQLTLASDKTEKERMGLNALVGAITDANTSEEVRKDLLIKLNSEYPDFLKNLDAESVSNETLTKRLKETNAQLLNKILLQRADERRKSKAQEQADAYEAQKKAIVSLSEKVEEYKKKFGVILDTNKTLIEQANELRAISTESALKPIWERDYVGIGVGADLKASISEIEKASKNYTIATEELSIKTSELIKLQKELGITLEGVAGETPDLSEWDKLRAAVRARYAEEIKAAGDKTDEILRLKKLEAAEIAKIDKREAESKKPKPKGLSAEDKKRLEALNLQLEQNSIALDDTKDKYQKMREAVKARYEAEIKTAKGKIKIIAALRQAEADDLKKIDNEEAKERLNKEQEQAQKIKEIRQNIAVMNAKDQFTARLQEIEKYYSKELELAADNAELIAALEEEKSLKIQQTYNDLAQHLADSYFEQHQIQASFLSAAGAGYDSFFNHITDMEMTGAEKRKAIMNDIYRAFVGSLAGMLKEYLNTELQKLIYTNVAQTKETAQEAKNSAIRVTLKTTEEAQKTAAQAAGSKTRAAIVAIENAANRTAQAAYIDAAAAGFFAAHAPIPFVGFGLASGFITAMMAELAGVAAGGKALAVAGAFNEGGTVENNDLLKLFVPEGEDGLVGVKVGEEIMNPEASKKYRPLLKAMNSGDPLPVDNGGKIGALKPFSNELNTGQSVENLRLPAGYSLSEISAPQPAPIQREYYSYEKVIERSVPVSGEFTIRTVAPDYADVRDYHIKVNREINRPDNRYVERNLETEDGPY